MKKVVYFCDKCGKEISAGSTGYQIVTKVFDHNGEISDELEGAELCEECYLELDELIAKFMTHIRPVEAAAEPKEKKTRKKRVELDLGKIGALWKAGWSIRKIAEEMKVSEPTIKARLEEMEAK